MTTKKAKKPVDGEELDEEGTEGDEEEGMEKKTAKGEDLTEDDLRKSLEKLEEVVAGGDESSRKETLLEKAKTEELDKSEQDELFQILGKSEGQPEDRLADDITGGLSNNDTMQKALDVSDFLNEQNTELVKSLEKLSDHVQGSDKRQHEFNMLLARGVVQTGRLVKSMAERLGVIENQPAREPKAKGAKALKKSFANQGGGGDGGQDLSKSQVLDVMEEMLRKSCDAGKGGMTDDGIDILKASTKYEQFNQISKSMLAKIREHVQNAGGTATSQ